MANTKAQQTEHRPIADTSQFTQCFSAIVARDGHRHARFGLAIHALDDGAILFENDAQSYFAGASTTKLPTVASALAALGPEFRFRTVVRHTGSIDTDGTLHGDLILVAGGDPNLSSRVTDDDTLAFADTDHALSGAPGARTVAGDPLCVMRKLARSVVAHGVRRIAGRVLVDISLFSEGARELGTAAVISPIVVNDNLIDVRVRAGNVPGEPVALDIAPPAKYVSFVNRALAGTADSPPSITLSEEVLDGSGARVVTISGSLAVGESQLYNHPVASPSAFAATIFAELLAELHVDSAIDRGSSIFSGADTLAPLTLAEHLSPPFAQAAKVINKVSQNLHAEICPRIVGATLDRAFGTAAEAAGFAHEVQFFSANAIDTDGIVQGDSCGMYGYFTPDFMCRFLRVVAAHRIAAAFRASLPILGRDGTLHDIATDSRAAGHVFAKTGTLGFEDRLRSRTIVQAKGLAGYIEAASGRSLVFALYANTVALEPGQTWSHVGQTLGEIAAAAYDFF